jgi:hypothetical protein
MSWSRVLLKKPTAPQSSRIFGTEYSLPHSQKPAVLSQTSSCLLILFNIILPSTPRSPSGPLPSSVHTKSLSEHLSSIRATWPAHLIIYDLLTPKIFAEVYREFSSSLRSFIHFPVTSSLLGPKISSAPYSPKHSSYISPWNWQTTFLTHTKLLFRIFNIYFCGYKTQEKGPFTEW